MRVLTTILLLFIMTIQSSFVFNNTDTTLSSQLAEEVCEFDAEDENEANKKHFTAAYPVFYEFPPGVYMLELSQHSQRQLFIKRLKDDTLTPPPLLHNSPLEA